MEILYLLIPLSALLVLLILGLFAWALHGGQFDEVEREGERILHADAAPDDVGQAPGRELPEQSRPTQSGPS